MNDPEIAQNGEIPMEYEYDEGENWDVWAAMIDAKLDAVMEHQKDHPRPQEGDGEVLMDHVEKRVENALVDYKKNTSIPIQRNGQCRAIALAGNCKHA